MEVIDGVRHIMNPKTPLKGFVSLEMEKKLEINPYEHEDFDLQSFRAVKDKDGEIILFDVNDSKAQRFTADGGYIGSFFRHGQGPGEFVPRRLLYVRFMNGQIWVTAGNKLAKFDKQGQFIDEISLGDTIALFIDERCYLTEKRTRKEQDTIKQIIIKHINDTNKIEEGPVLMDGKNLGMIRLPRGGFGDGWGTPDIDREMKVLPKGYLAVYRISGLKRYVIDIFDESGNYVYMIEPSDSLLLDRADFYDFGLTTVEFVDDFPVYVEYRIKNLPEIFSESSD